MIHNTDAMEQMKNPLSPVKMVRETYSRWLQKNITEVQVQFKDEEPAWIPYDTLLAMQEVNENWNTGIFRQFIYCKMESTYSSKKLWYELWWDENNV